MKELVIYSSSPEHNLGLMYDEESLNQFVIVVVDSESEMVELLHCGKDFEMNEFERRAHIEGSFEEEIFVLHDIIESFGEEINSGRPSKEQVARAMELHMRTLDLGEKTDISFYSCLIQVMDEDEGGQNGSSKD